MIKTINKKKVLPLLINQQRQHLFYMITPPPITTSPS